MWNVTVSKAMGLPGSELYWDTSLQLLERWYSRLLGIPIIGLRIRLRRVKQLLPKQASCVLDAGCGRGVIARALAQKYPDAKIDAVDANSALQEINQELAKMARLENCRFITADLLNFKEDDRYDLIVSVDNLEHVDKDYLVLDNFYRSMTSTGSLLIHVPHYYRRWPVFRWSTNFDVPGHVRPGYHLPELTERVRRAGFKIARTGFSYGFIENLINNLSYRITGAQEKNKVLYAVLFPILNAIAWLGQWSKPSFGAGVWIIAEKVNATTRPTVIKESKG